MKEKYSFNEFVDIIKVLRSENGCPWDKEQTHESLRAAMIEEAYEAVDAIDKNDMNNLCEELGDVLMQVVFHAGIEAEKGGFTIDDVIDGISRKMILRHPHIFAGETAETAEDVLEKWEKIKKKEKGFKTQTEIMEAVPKALPALIRAKKIQSKAADVGFDFENTREAVEKLDEEIQEFKNALYFNDGGTAEEFGDILFSLVNISRFLGINAEFSLTNASEKFINRFRYIEGCALLKGKNIEELTIDEMNEIWEDAKQYNLNSIQGRKYNE
ncbi:nucleoside triphosphate pyrophosphohydrolase [Anaerotignum faecicola]